MRKAGTGKQIPPPLEMLCLKALWTLQEGRVEDVRRQIADTRPLAYTTVMTVLERLSKRNAVSRRKVGRSFLYVPQVSRETLRNLAVQDLLEMFFDGSKEELEKFLRETDAEPERARAVVQAAFPDSQLDAVLL